MPNKNYNLVAFLQPFDPDSTETSINATKMVEVSARLVVTPSHISLSSIDLHIPVSSLQVAVSSGPGRVVFWPKDNGETWGWQSDPSNYVAAVGRLIGRDKQGRIVS